MGRKPTPQYILFGDEQFDDIKWSLPVLKIEAFKEQWNMGQPLKNICRQLKISELEAALLLLDLSYRGQIKPRKEGLRGIA